VAGRPIGIEGESVPVTVPSTEFAPTAAECAGYVIDNAELRRLAAWAVDVPRTERIVAVHTFSLGRKPA
jgi:hypothetical protein